MRSVWSRFACAPQTRDTLMAVTLDVSRLCGLDWGDFGHGSTRAAPSMAQGQALHTSLPSR